MEIDLEKIERAVSAAIATRDGNWKSRPSGVYDKFSNLVVPVSAEVAESDSVDDSTLDFIAAVNPAVITELVRRLKVAEQDAARYQFLRGRLEGFGWHGGEQAVLSFSVPMETVTYRECDLIIDSAMAAARSGGSA